MVPAEFLDLFHYHPFDVQSWKIPGRTNLPTAFECVDAGVETVPRASLLGGIGGRHRVAAGLTSQDALEQRSGISAVTVSVALLVEQFLDGLP
jgi:hypothetical protein